MLHRSGRLIAVAEPDPALREAFAGLFLISLGCETCSASSLAALTIALRSRMPFVIIAAGDAREYAPRPLFDWFPLLPVVALGCPVRHLRPVVDYPVLARPVDADRLLAHVRALMLITRVPRCTARICEISLRSSLPSSRGADHHGIERLLAHHQHQILDVDRGRDGKAFDPQGEAKRGTGPRIPM
jgi:hypothetical protein